MVAAAGPLEGRAVVEIGAGLGALTLALAAAGAARVLAVEKDLGLATLLGENTAGWENVEVVLGDALDLDLASLAGGDPLVLGNLPYSITTPLLLKLLRPPVFWPRAVVMVQAEVAERITARPGTKEYGTLSLAVSRVARPELAFRVGRNSFYPRPEVDSAVLTLARREVPAGGLDPAGLDRLEVVIRAAFGHRRKRLSNALAAGLGLDRETVSRAVAGAGLDPGRRGETLDLEEFVTLERALRGLLGAAGREPLPSTDSPGYNRS